MANPETEKSRQIVHDFFEKNKPYSLIDAIKVNKILDIDPASGINKEPALKVNIDCLTPDILRLVREHPLDTELFIGWDLVNGKLKITEVTQGISPEEVEKRNQEYAKEQNPFLRKKLVGSVCPVGRHLVEFHTHPRTNYTPEEWEDVDKIRQATPPTYWGDFFNFIKCPSNYVNIVLDTSEWNGSVVGRVLLGIKTEDTIRINEENAMLYTVMLTHEIQLREIFDDHPHRHANQMLFGDNSMVTRLQQDEHWATRTGIVLYRGKLLEGAQSVKLLRSDKYYDRLMRLRKKFLGII